VDAEVVCIFSVANSSHYKFLCNFSKKFVRRWLNVWFFYLPTQWEGKKGAD